MLDECGVEIYNGKKVLPTLTATQAAIAFEISDDRFRRLKRCGVIPGVKDGSWFLVNVKELNSLILNGEISVKPYQSKDKLSDEEKKKRRQISNQKYKAAHKEQANQYVRERKQTDPVYKLKCQARNTIYHSFARTGNAKQERCERVTGLPISDLITYLCSTYEQVYGKAWDGIEPVHIDHIVPLATAKTEDDVMRLCHYTNLQLLTARDNLAKGSKYAKVQV